MTVYMLINNFNTMWVSEKYQTNIIPPKNISKHEIKKKSKIRQPESCIGKLTRSILIGR